MGNFRGAASPEPSKSKPGPSIRRWFNSGSVRVAIACFLLAGASDWTAVHFAYGSNWTALFCAGGNLKRPPEVASREYVFANSYGYDGQFYQLIARDPVFKRGYDRFIDAPRLRYRRILLPALGAIAPDWAYFTAVWGFVGVGAYCLGELTAPLWGFLFLLMPATLVGLDRMTVDVSLTALTLAAILAARRERWVVLWVSLAAAFLSKETGILAIGGIVIWLLRQRRFRAAALMCTTALPALLWNRFVQAHTHGDYATTNFGFLTPLFAVTGRPVVRGPVGAAMWLLGVLSAIGMLWAIVEAIVLGFSDRLRDPALAVCLTLGLFAILWQDRSIWEDPYSFARVYSPLLAALIAGAWQRRPRILIPCALTVPAVGLQCVIPLLLRAFHLVPG